MSINKEEKNTDNTPEEIVEDIVETNVALLKAKIIQRDELIVKQKKVIDALTAKYSQAKEFIDQDAKADLLAEIDPRVETSKDILMLKSIEQLKVIKSVLDTARVPTFQSSTQVFNLDKESERSKLANVTDEYMAKIRGSKK